MPKIVVRSYTLHRGSNLICCIRMYILIISSVKIIQHFSDIS